MDIQYVLPDQLTDEEIFIGQLSLKEVKKRLISSPQPHSHHRQTVGYVHIDCKDDTNSSIKIIETHSAPDVSPNADLHPSALSKSESTPSLSPEKFCDWDIKPDDSFLKLEQMVSKMCKTPDNHCGDTDLNEYCFTNPLISREGFKNLPISKINSQSGNEVSQLISSNEYHISEIATIKDEPHLVSKTPLKNKYMKSKLPVTSHDEVFKTPSSELKVKTPVFKTPGNPSSHKKLGTPRKYQNVISPVATYIRNCPQVPLIKDIYPKRPLPGVSSIPKPLKLVSQQNGNKENIKQESVKSVKQKNVNLPMLAYRNAMETKVIDIPDVDKMPQSQWAKQVASAIPRAMIVKHNHRETGSAKKPLQNTQENSFADLSLHQADLSVCTQTSTFSKLKKNI